MVIAVFVQVLNRNFFLLVMPWLDEMAIYSMMFLVMLGTEMGLRDGTQISITGVVDRFKGRIKTAIQIVAKLIVVSFSCVMFAASLNIVMSQAKSGQTSPALGIPMWFPYVAFLAAFGIIVLVQGWALVLLCKAFIKNDSKLSDSIGETQDEVEMLMAEAESNAASKDTNQDMREEKGEDK